MTANREDYLKVIYEEGGVQKPVPNKIIAEKLGVAPSSVTEMLTKIARQGLIKYESYKGSSLTKQGLQACLEVVRSHRLWEVFLMRHLGYSWSEAHEDAHLLEHTAPVRMIERLENFLNYPEYCPHGAVIPTSDGIVRSIQLVPLSSLTKGMQAVARQIDEDQELLDYLEISGLKLDCELTVEGIGAYEGGYEIRQQEIVLHISHKAAGRIFVEIDGNKSSKIV